MAERYMVVAKGIVKEEIKMDKRCLRTWKGRRKRLMVEVDRMEVTQLKRAL